MNYKKLLAPFKRRLLPEQLGHAALIGLGTSAGVVLITSLLYHILCVAPSSGLLLWLGVGVFFLAFIICMLTIDRPGTAKTASRVDELGLQDRVATMLEFQKNSSEMAALQRADALEKLNQLEPKQLKRSFSMKGLLLALSLLLAMTIMLVIPYDIFVKAADPVDEHAQMIKDLISDLRDQLDNLENRDDILEEITEIIDNLKDSLDNPELSEEELAAKIDTAKNKIDAILDKAISRDEIGEALQRFMITREMGEAISDNDTTALKEAMDKLFEDTKASSNTVKELSEAIKEALELSEVSSEDLLYQSLYSFSAGLDSIYASAGPDTSVTAAGLEETLIKVFSDAYDAMLDALSKQDAWEAAGEEVNDLLQDAKDDLLGIEDKPEDGQDSEEGENPEDGEKPEEGEKPEDGEKPENGEKPDGEKPDGEMPDGGMPDGEAPEDGNQGGGGMPETKTEPVYDPYLGSITYGDVFDSYYADYLKQLQEGNISEDVQEAIDKYYNSLDGSDREENQ